jgi:hypothetical protein
VEIDQQTQRFIQQFHVAEQLCFVDWKDHIVSAYLAARIPQIFKKRADKQKHRAAAATKWMRRAKRTNFHGQFFETFEAFCSKPLCVSVSGPTIKTELATPDDYSHETARRPFFNAKPALRTGLDPTLKLLVPFYPLRQELGILLPLQQVLRDY